VDAARGRDCHRIDIFPIEDEAGNTLIRLYISTPEDSAGHWIDLLPTDALSIGHGIVQKSTAALAEMVERSRDVQMPAALGEVDGLSVQRKPTNGGRQKECRNQVAEGARSNHARS
jgi:hypothetical protein